MDVNNLTSVYYQNPTLQSQYTLQQYLDLFGGSSTGTTTTTPTPTTTTTTATTAGLPAVTQPIINYNQGGGNGDDDDTTTGTNPGGKFDLASFAKAAGFVFNPIGTILGLLGTKAYQNYKNPYKNITGGLNKATRDAIGRDQAATSAGTHGGYGSGTGGVGASGPGSGGGYNEGNFCFDPSTLIQMADGSTKKIKNIQLGDDTKGGEVTGVFQFKATDEIHDYKGVTVAGSHFVKEDGKFIMVKDSPLAVKIDKIPVVYSLDTTGRRIFINDIEFADYNGDGVAKNFLSNAGVDLTGFDKEVLRQVEHRLI